MVWKSSQTTFIALNTCTWKDKLCMPYQRRERLDQSSFGFKRENHCTKTEKLLSLRLNRLKS